MRHREQETARKFGVLKRLEQLQEKLKEIDYVADVGFDLDGFWSNIRQVIILPKYDIPVALPNYFEARHEMLKQILYVASSFGLLPSGDRIEDYGEHFYIVRACDSSWKLERQRGDQEQTLPSQCSGSIDGIIQRAEKQTNNGLKQSVCSTKALEELR